MFFGPKNNAAYAVPVYSGIQISTSQFDLPIAVFWGRRRLPTNCIAYVNFTAKPAGQKKIGSGGKKGAGQNTYSASVALGLCEGPIDDVKRVFVNGSTTTTETLAALVGSGGALFNGTSAQTPWSYWTSAGFPAYALAYRNIAYLGIPNMALGYTPNVPDNQPECDRANGFAYVHTTNGWIDPVSHVQDADAIDCLPSDILNDLLTNTRYGFGFTGADFTANLAQYASYCRAQGIFFSPLLSSQEKCTSIIDRWAQLSNTWIFWNGTQVDFCPLGDQPLTANGVTYTPTTAVQAALSLAGNDFLGDPPLTVTRKDPADCYNRTRLDITDRTLGYISNPFEYKDQTLVDQYGLRDNSSVQGTDICDPPVGQIVVQLIGKRAAYIRNTYKWKSSWRRIGLLPGDIVTLTEPNIGLNGVGVRITSVTEAEDYSLEFTAEEYPGILGQYVSSNPPAATAASFPDQFAIPSSVNTPSIIEPNSSFTGGKPVIVIAASGTSNWGGCTVNISFDAVNYSSIGRITSPAIQGALTANLASHADPDNTNTLSVDTTQCGTAIPTTIAHADADADRSLAVIAAQPTASGGAMVMPVNGEMLSFGTVTATGTFTAGLTYLRRGQFGTSPASHSTGDQFGMIDVLGVSGTSVVYSLPTQYIGVPIYFKLQSVNAFGNALQDLSTCTEYRYTPTGLGYGTAASGVPAVPTGLAAAISGASVVLSWAANPAADNVTGYKVFRATGTGASFGSASQIATIASLTWTDPSTAASTGYTYFLEAVNAAGSSANTSGVNATTGSGPTGSVGPSSGGKPTNRVSSRTSLGGTGTTSTTGVMQGFGSTLALTPSSTGNIRVRIDLLSKNAASGILNTIQLYYGTGSAPTNGAALTGTAVLSQPVLATSPAANGLTPAPVEAEITGLTLSTAYWFDLSLATGNASDLATIFTTYELVEEF